MIERALICKIIWHLDPDTDSDPDPENPKWIDLKKGLTTIPSGRYRLLKLIPRKERYGS